MFCFDICFSNVVIKEKLNCWNRVCIVRQLKYTDCTGVCVCVCIYIMMCYICFCLGYLRVRICSAGHSHHLDHFLPLEAVVAHTVTLLLLSLSLSLSLSLCLSLSNNPSSVWKILKALTLLLFGVIECWTTLSLSPFHSLVLSVFLSFILLVATPLSLNLASTRTLTLNLCGPPLLLTL